MSLLRLDGAQLVNRSPNSLCQIHFNVEKKNEYSICTVIVVVVLPRKILATSKGDSIINIYYFIIYLICPAPHIRKRKDKRKINRKR